MTERPLVVGGTGPIGRHVVRGLRDRGGTVTICHRGNHELAEHADLAHLRDVHFADTIDRALGDRCFDTVVCMHGRPALIADHAAERRPRTQFIGVGTNLGYRGWVSPGPAFPTGAPVPCPEDPPKIDRSADGDSRGIRFAAKIHATESTARAHHEGGSFRATWLRYPMIYGPRNVIPWEWSVLKRVQDRRPLMVISDEGLEVTSRTYTANAAHAVLLAYDQPAASAGKVYNCADDQQGSPRQWIEPVPRRLRRRDGPGITSLGNRHAPWALMPPHMDSVGSHGLVDTSKIREQLGYRDVVAVPRAIRETVDHYRAHPVTSEAFPHLQDSFAYAAEDRLVREYRRALDNLRPAGGAAHRELFHAYPHPREVEGVRTDVRGR